MQMERENKQNILRVLGKYIKSTKPIPKTKHHVENCRCCTKNYNKKKLISQQ